MATGREVGTHVVLHPFQYFTAFYDQAFAQNPAGSDLPEGYYSFDVGAWRVISINSNCSTGSVNCDPEDPEGQLAWLTDDLDAHQNLCTLAFWHHPRFTTGLHRDADGQGAPLDVSTSRVACQ